MKSWALFLLIAVLLTGRESEAATWLVGGPDGDFAEITDALVAATDGDLILVRPGSYQSFVVVKGVEIVASSAPYTVQAPGITISGIGAGRHAAVAGASLVGASRLIITDCPGEVTLADLAAGSDLVDVVSVQSAANLSISRAVITSLAGSDQAAPPPTVNLVSSSVRLSSVEVYAADGADEGLGVDGAGGSAGLQIQGSTVVVARATVIGGNGGRGAEGAGGNGGAGGDALSTDGSRVIAMGETLDWFQGGDGGTGASAGGRGGDGGAGLREAGGSAIVSRVTLSGGAGGGGAVPGTDGPDADGQVSRDDRFPYLDATGTLIPGGSFVLDITAVESGGVVLLASQQGGFLEIPFVGPPLSAVPGGWFLVLFVGRADSNGRYNLVAAIPPDAFTQGLVFHIQAALLGDSGTDYLTNELGLAVGE